MSRETSSVASCLTPFVWTDDSAESPTSMAIGISDIVDGGGVEEGILWMTGQRGDMGVGDQKNK